MGRILTWPLRIAIRVLLLATCVVAAVLAWNALPPEVAAIVRSRAFEPAADVLRAIADRLDPARSDPR